MPHSCHPGWCTPRHGTSIEYNYHGCRCAECRAYKAAHKRQAKQKARRKRGQTTRWEGHVASMLEDYQFIGGTIPPFPLAGRVWEGISARQAAERLGVSTRTVQRYRARLRAAQQEAAA